MRLLKEMAVWILIFATLLLSLEIAQRVRWYYKTGKSSYWLKYGFVPRPADYEQQLYKAQNNKTKNNKINEIPIFIKEFPNGLIKHNPANSDINSLGYRSKEFKAEKPQGIYRIAAFGGSTTAGYENAVENTYPSKLEKLLGKRFEVINCGMGGQDVRYVNNLLDKEVRNFSPDMATLYLTCNKIFLSMSSVTPKKDLRYFLWKTKMFLSSKSLLVLTVREKVALKKFGMITQIYSPASNSRDMAKNFMNSEFIFSDYENELKTFCKICKENGIKAVLISEACSLKRRPGYMITDIELKPVYEKLWQVMKNVAIKEGVDYIDIAHIGLSDDLFTDGVHLTDKGNDKIAEILYEYIEKLKVGGKT
jgi:lysophospholipase L1-like esterase